VRAEVRKWRGNKGLIEHVRKGYDLDTENVPSPVLDLMIATNQPRLLATTKSCPLLGIGARSSGSGESLTRVRLLTSLIDKNCSRWYLSISD